MTRTDVSLRVGMTHHFHRFCTNLEDIILARMPGQSSLVQLSLTINSLDTSFLIHYVISFLMRLLDFTDMPVVAEQVKSSKYQWVSTYQRY